MGRTYKTNLNIYPADSIIRMFAEIPRDPARAMVRLRGEYDIERLVRQAEEIIPGMEIERGVSHDFALVYPKNNVIKELLLRHARKREDSWQTRLRRVGSERDVELTSAEWSISEAGNMGFTWIKIEQAAGYILQVHDSGQRPGFVSAMLKALRPDYEALRIDC